MDKYLLRVIYIAAKVPPGAWNPAQCKPPHSVSLYLSCARYRSYGGRSNSGSHIRYITPQSIQYVSHATLIGTVLKHPGAPISVTNISQKSLKRSQHRLLVGCGYRHAHRQTYRPHTTAEHSISASQPKQPDAAAEHLQPFPALVTALTVCWEPVHGKRTTTMRYVRPACATRAVGVAQAWAVERHELQLTSAHRNPPVER